MSVGGASAASDGSAVIGGSVMCTVGIDDGVAVGSSVSGGGGSTTTHWQMI